MKFLTNTCLQSEFSDTPLPKLKKVSDCMRRCTTTIKAKIFLMIVQCLQFISFCVQKLILYQNLVIISRRFFLSKILCTSLMREWKNYSRSSKRRKYIPSNDQHQSPIDEQHTSGTFQNPYSLWDVYPASLMSLKHTTTDRDSMSNKWPQTTTHQTLARYSAKY